MRNLFIVISFALINIYSLHAMETLTSTLHNLDLNADIITLIGNDDISVKIPRQVATLSARLDSMIDEMSSSDNKINLSNITGDQLKCIAKALKTIHHQFGNDSYAILKTTYNTNRALQLWFNKLKLEDCQTMINAAQYLSLPLLTNMIEIHAKQLPNLRANYLRNVCPQIIQFCHDDSQLQALKLFILDHININPIEKESTDYEILYLKNRYHTPMSGTELFTSKDGQLIKTFKLDGKCIYEGDISHDGKWIAMRSNNDTLHILNFQTNEQIKTFSDCQKLCDWSPNNQWITYLTKQNTIKLYNIETDENKEINGYNAFTAIWSPHSVYLAIMKRYGIQYKIIIWNTQRNQCIKTLVDTMHKISWWRFGKQLIAENYIEYPTKALLRIFNIETISHIDDYFNGKINSLEEFIFLKEINQARLNSTHYKLSKEEQITFNNISKDNQEVGDAIRNVLAPFVIQNQ